MSKVLNSFLVAYERIDHEIDSDLVKASANGTGYLDGLVTLDKPDDVDVSRFTDSHGRRGIVYYTPTGNVVVFERYVRNSESDVIPFVSNGPRWWKMLSSGAIDIDLMDTLSNNINYPNNVAKAFISDLNKYQ
tara:strand:- start:53516 stop:53914 length:399 start_codon:yes stop_codon:yes gene_type:complete